MGDPVQSGAPFYREFDLVEACEPVIFSFTKDCNCVADAGTMASDPICSSTQISGQFQNDAQLDTEDVLQFVLHNNSGNFLGTIFGIGDSPDFDGSSMLDNGGMYYLSPIVGRNDGTGAVDLDDPCLSVGYGQPVIFSPAPQIDTPEGNITCAGVAIPLAVELPPTATIAWSPDNGLSCLDCPQPLANPDTTTTYTALVSEENGCSNTVTTTIYVNEFPLGTFPEEAFAVCPGSTFEFCAPEAVTYAWTGPAGYQSSSSCLIIPEYSDYLDGIFTLEATLANGCTAIGQIELAANPSLSLVSITPDTAICPNQFVTLSAEVENADYYFWFPVSQVFCQNCPTTLAFADEPTVFTLIALDELGCQLQTHVEFDIKSGCPGSEVILGGLSSDDTGIGIEAPPTNTPHTAASVLIFPNPTTGLVHVRATEESIEEVQVFSLEGKMLKRYRQLVLERPLDLSPLPAATYLIKVVTAQGVVTKKIVLLGG